MEQAPASRMCRIGRHRWTRTAGATSLTCFSCHAVRPRGKTLACRVGRHRSVGVVKDGGDPYRECFFCGKYGGGRKFV